MAKTINTESFEAWENEMRLWDLNSVIFKNRYKKPKSRKKLAEQFSVLVLVLASHKILHSFSSPAKVLPTRVFFSFSYFFSQVVKQL